MARTETIGPLGAALPVLAAVAAMASFQVGAAIAKSLFPSVGPQGAAALRLLLGAALLFVLVRPRRAWPAQAPLLALFALGAAMGGTILMFYLAIQRLPLGAAVALQFLGPLAIALLGSRRVFDLLWAGLAGGGVWLLVGAGADAVALDPVGIACALGAAAGWGSYILLGGRVGARFGSSTAALALGLAGLIVLPAGLHEAGAALFSPALIPLALLVALFSSAIPFSLEFYALPRLPAKTFAVLMSLEPCFGVLSGLFLLNEALASAQVVGVVMVVTAAAGAAWAGVGVGTAAPPA